MKREKYAIKGYFFGKVYKDLINTIVESFKETRYEVCETAKSFKDIFSDHGIFFGIGLYGYYSIIIAARFLFGFLFTALLSLLIVIGAAIVMCGLYIGFFVLATIDTIYRNIKKINNSCSNCQRKFDVPVYHCPKCGAPHKYLYPSVYGIMHHRCTCGELLPTLPINGRHKLVQTCPHCEEKIVGGLHHATIFPVFGGRSSGKTCFINSALNEIEALSAKNNYEYEYFYDVKGDERQRFKDYLKKGIFPESTHDDSLVFYNFYFNKKGEKIKNLISLCDVSGEVFQRRDTITKQIGYRYADSIIFVLDPLSIEEFRNELSEQGYDVASYSYSAHPIGDIIGAMLTSLNDLYKTEDWKLKLAVVFTKADMPVFKDRFSKESINLYKKSHKKKTIQAARDGMAEEFLSEFGEGNTLNLMKNHFSEIHYFVSSTTGDKPVEGEPFVSYGSSDPIMWVIKSAYKNIDIKSEGE